jgi:hypothetical protein
MIQEPIRKQFKDMVYINKSWRNYNILDQFMDLKLKKLCMYYISSVAIIIMVHI